jgi:hypothetical protein
VGLEISHKLRKGTLPTMGKESPVETPWRVLCLDGPLAGHPGFCRVRDALELHGVFNEAGVH